MKILLVSWSVLPQKGGSSIIVENLAKNFSAEEMVVLGSRKLWQGAAVERPANGPTFHYFFSELYFMGRGYRYFVWFRKWRFQPLVAKIKALIREEKIEQVIGVYPNPFYCLAACRAAKELGIPFSAYFHNTYLENTAITDPEAPKIQAEIFDYAQTVFVMSKGMQAFYEKKYPQQNFVPLVHTFDEFPPPESLQGLPGESKAHYKLVAIGNFNESNMEATIRLARAIKNNPKYSLSIYTHVPQVLLRKRGLDTDTINYCGFVGPEELHEVLQQYDVGVLTHGFTGGYGKIEYQTIFPTRTIPFLLAGKPILVHSPPGSFLNDFIRENECGELVDQASETAIIRGLERICNSQAYQEQLVAASQETARQFHGKRVVEQLRNNLNPTKNIADEIEL